MDSMRDITAHHHLLQKYIQPESYYDDYAIAFSLALNSTRMSEIHNQPTLGE